MMIFFWRMTATVLLAAALTLLFTACTFPEKLPRGLMSRELMSREIAKTATSPVVHVVTPRPRIVQRGHGRQAVFKRCTPPNCPAVSGKTLAMEPMEMAPPHAGALLPWAPIEAASHSPNENVVANSKQERLASRAGNAQSGFESSSSAQPSTAATETVTIAFGFGDAKLSAKARDAIDRAAAAWSSASNVIVRGRTDIVGSIPANESLAWARAHAVRDHLRRFHPALSAVVSVEARGSCCYSAPNDTPDGRARNRRVEILFERHPEGM